jgi:hypothetical protein
MNGYSCPCLPPLCLRTASRVLVTLPLSCLSPRHGQHHAGGFLAGCATGAGFQALAEVIDAQDEAAEFLCDRLQYVHDRLSDGIVVFIAGPAVARTGGNGINPYQPQRQPELLL